MRTLSTAFRTALAASIGSSFVVGACSGSAGGIGSSDAGTDATDAQLSSTDYDCQRACSPGETCEPEAPDTCARTVCKCVGGRFSDCTVQGSHAKSGDPCGGTDVFGYGPCTSLGQACTCEAAKNTSPSWSCTAPTDGGEG